MSGDSVGPFCSLLTVGAVGFIGLLVSDSFGISAYFDAYSQRNQFIHYPALSFVRLSLRSFVSAGSARTGYGTELTEVGRSGP